MGDALGGSGQGLAAFDGGGSPGPDAELAASPGAPLDAAIADRVDALLGIVVGTLRIHTDELAARAADRLGTAAFVAAPAPAGAPGPELYFGRDQYDPAGTDGLKLITRLVVQALSGVAGPVREPGELTEPAATTAPVPTPRFEPPAAPEEPTGEVTEAPLPTAEGRRTPAEGPPEAAGPPEADGLPTPEGPIIPEAAQPEIPLHIPPAPTTPSPAAQTRITTVTTGIRTTAQAAEALPTPDTTTQAARTAVTEPPEETSARAEAALTEALGERPAPSPEILKLCDVIRTAIRERRPKDEDDLVKAEPEKMAAQAGQSLSAVVEGDASRVSSEYNALQGRPTGVPQQTGQPITASPAGIPALTPDAVAAVPDPIPPEDLALEEDKADLDQRIASSGMERPASEPLQEPPFSTVREGQAELSEMAATRPAEVVAAQEEALAQARTGMTELQQRAVEALASSRAGTVADIGTRQTGMVGTEEETRATVSRQAGQIFGEAQAQVAGLLTPLTQAAMRTWRAGVERHSTEFRQSLDRVAAWIEERHEGVGGAVLGAWDALTGLPGWVVEEYDRAERLFGDRICDLLREISADVESVIAAAEAIIEDARRRIEELFAALPEELREWADGERAAFAQQFDGLHAQVAATRDGFTRDLTREAVTTVSAVQREVEALREAAGGLIGRVVSAIEEFLEDPVRAIVNGLLRLLGISPAAFWALVDKLTQVISDIADDPRRFGNNLVAVLAQGFQQFFDNFGTHVLKGFFDWLFRGLGSVGVQLPKDFSVPSIITFALQLMGLSWGNIRQILVRHVGEDNVALIEQAWSLISTLIERGPEGIMEMLRDRLEPGTLFREILDAAVAYMVETLVQQAAIRVLGLLNPAGAVLQAIELIYKVLRWVFENAAPIFRLVETVVNGAADILAGNIAGTATAVELSLAAVVPVVIDLLAGLVGLGDLPEKVVEVIKKFQAYVLRIVESVIEWLVKRGRELLARLGLTDEEEAKGETGDQEPGMTITFTAGGETHRHWAEVSGGDGDLMVASDKLKLKDRLDEWEKQAPARFEGDDVLLGEVKELIGHVRTELNPAEALLEHLVASREAAGKLPGRPGGKVEPLPDDALERQQQIMVRLLGRLFDLFEAPGQDKLPEIADRLPKIGGEFGGDVHESWRKSQIERPKIATPNEVSLYGSGVLAGTDKNALLYTEQPGTHEVLLPYFRVGKRDRKVDSQEFAHYVFRTTTPDPPHFVRRTFLDLLGENAAQALRTAGQAVVTPEFDAHVNQEIGDIAYDREAGPYGRFVPFVGGTLHPDLVAAVERAGDVYRFFRQLIRHPDREPMTWARFSAIWNTGGASPNWVKDQWRALRPGTHEWIPVDYIRNVLEHAIEVAKQEGFRRGLQWLRVLHQLRSPTNYVMWSIGEIVAIEYREDEPPRPFVRPELLAHVGTASREGEPTRPAGTVGSKYFHDTLREFFRDYQGFGATPRQFVEDLRVDVRARLLWDGSTDFFRPEQLDLRLGVDINVEGTGWVPGMTIRELAKLQAKQVARIEADFDKVIGKLSL
ncbi:hypothetical protein [Nonomuraea bangladeshensis]|uniref:hypothetical protein n=1 Tax=Nonomuraea bangladeshensis TaxID=404385 RepID=UPI003C2CF6AB